jgi:tRNA-guanine family transglycosylase
MTGELEPADGELQSVFDTAMFSVSSFVDYGITSERLEDYLAVPIKDRRDFDPFDGMLFVDSGGFKFLQENERSGAFEDDIDQEEALRMQRRLGGDIIVNLDRPLSPTESYDQRTEKMERTAANVRRFCELLKPSDGAAYLTVHGYNYSMIDRYLDTINEALAPATTEETFDGIALGSLVGRKDSAESLVQAVGDCTAVLAERGLDDLPLHVLGLSSSSIPLMAAMGVDSFDSATYLHTAVNGHYSTSLVGKVPLEEVSFDECGCPVCSTPALVDRMRGNAEYQKDILGPVAMHNLFLQKQEMNRIRNYIQLGETQRLIDYIDAEVAQSKRLRQVAHDVVIDALGGYF